MDNARSANPPSLDGEKMSIPLPLEAALSCRAGKFVLDHQRDSAQIGVRTRTFRQIRRAFQIGRKFFVSNFQTGAGICDSNESPV